MSANDLIPWVMTYDHHGEKKLKFSKILFSDQICAKQMNIVISAE